MLSRGHHYVMLARCAQLAVHEREEVSLCAALLAGNYAGLSWARLWFRCGMQSLLSSVLRVTGNQLLLCFPYRLFNTVVVTLTYFVAPITCDFDLAVRHESDKLAYDIRFCCVLTVRWQHLLKHLLWLGLGNSLRTHNFHTGDPVYSLTYPEFKVHNG